MAETAVSAIKKKHYPIKKTTNGKIAALIVLKIKQLLGRRKITSSISSSASC